LSVNQARKHRVYLDCYAPGVALVKSIEKERVAEERKISRIELVVYRVQPQERQP